MTRLASLVALPVAALLLVGGVLGVQLAHGGGTFEPLRPANPCTVHRVSSRASGLDGLTERLVLLGLDDAACRLHTSREELTLRLAQPGTRTDSEIRALRAGLLMAVRQLQSAGSLPPAADLVDEALDSSDLNVFVKAAIRALPDSVVNAALKTDDVLTRTIENLDLRSLLANMGDQGDLTTQVDAAVTQAVKDSLVARLHDLL